MGLIKDFTDQAAKSKIKGANSIADFDVQYPSGFVALDMANGQRIYVQDKSGRHFSYVSAGIVDGSTNCFIGRSGCGKSTICLQIGSNIVTPFIREGMDSDLFIDDIEGGLPQSRREFLLGMTADELHDHVIIRNNDITTENVLERFNIIANHKLEHRNEFEYDTRLFNSYGEKIIKLVPTVYIIDSIAVLMPEDVSEKDDLGTNATGMSIAKQNTMLFKKINQLCKAANIILLSINHILPRPQLGFMPTQSQVDGLKTDERLAGATTAVYLSNNIFRLDEKTTLKDSEGYGINGKIVDVSLVKSRTNATRRAVPVIFDKTHGYFNNNISLLHLLKQEGRVSGVGSNVHLGDCPTKFSLKNFDDLVKQDPELNQALAQEAYSVLNSYLSDTKVVRYTEEDKAKSGNISSMIAQMGFTEYDFS